MTDPNTDPPRRFDRTGLRQAAIAVLERNWTGVATLPSPAQYPHQWSWDSAFIAIGWAHIEPARARTELTALFQGQWSDGRVPHIQFNPEVDEDAYFPGPRFWNSAANPHAPAQATSGIVQPPVHARAAWHIHQTDPASPKTLRFLTELYPRLVAWHQYLLRRRHLVGSSLVPIVHPWESGMDNSPQWDAALAHSGTVRTQRFVRRDTASVDAAQRPSDFDYQHYVSLASRYRDVGYDDSELADHPFIVEDPLFNSVLLDGELCLSRIAALIGHDPHPHETTAHELSTAMNAALWDAERGWFGGRDVATGGRLTELTAGGLAPLLDPWLPAKRRDRTLALARSDRFVEGCTYPLPTVATTSSAFDRIRYWRGPMWANTNWLIYVGARLANDTALATTIAEATLDAVCREGFREYYDPFSGAGLGATDFSWTAALTIDWLAELDSSVAFPAAARGVP